MRAYWAIFLAGFRRQATYRLALVSGLGTNVFFGVVRSALFYALYRQRPAGQVGGLGVGDALTYVWIIQALFGAVFTTWFWELAESVRSGEFTVELLRPGDPYLRLLSFDVGRNVNVMLVRSTVPLVGAALLLPLHLPGDPLGVALLAASMLLAALAGFEIRFLFSLAAFWVPDYRAVWNLLFPLLWLLAGFVIPIAFFPHGLRMVAEASPLVALLMAPVRVAIGQDPARALALQAGWVLALGVANRSALALAARRLVVHGG